MPGSGYFYDETNRNKLIVLYFIKSLNIELTRSQIADFSVAHDLIPYFDLQTTVGELEESGLLACVPKAFGQAFMLTPQGRDIIEMFQERIPQSQRDTLDRYADECREQLRLDTQYSATGRELYKGGYGVTLKAMDSSRTLLGIEFMLPDSKSANKAIARWRASSADIYRYLVQVLVEDAPGTKKEQQKEETGAVDEKEK